MKSGRCPGELLRRSLQLAVLAFGAGALGFLRSINEACIFAPGRQRAP